MPVEVLFVMTTMRTGGIATSLHNLLHELVNDTNYHLTLLLFDDSFVIDADIPEGVDVITAGQLPRVIALSQNETFSIDKKLAYKRLFAGFLAKFFSQELAYTYLFRGFNLNRHWDVAISCTQSAPNHHLYGGCNEFVLNKINATKKLTFIHCDYISYGLKSRYNHKIYSSFNCIATVSDSVRRVFLEAEPSLSSKTITIYNCHDVRRILEKSEMDPIKTEKSFFNIVTVARLSEEKGHVRALNAIGRLINEGYSIKWHVVGGSNDDFIDAFSELINKHGINKNVILYGEQKNPYRIMKQCDLLLVPSIHEAAPMVFGEAEILKLPILTTETISAIELVENKKIGWVCDNSEDGIYKGLKELLDSRILVEKCRDGMKPISNDVAINQLKEAIGRGLDGAKRSDIKYR